MNYDRRNALAVVFARLARGRFRHATARLLEKAKDYAVRQVKEAISLPAIPGVRATPGSPMRMASGRAYASVYGWVEGQRIFVSIMARSPKGFNYPAFHEFKKGGMSGRHPSVRPTLAAHTRDMARILRGAG